jgi:ERCC4-type nuclease
VDSREQNGAYAVKRFTEAGIESDIICWPTETGTDYFITNTHGSVAVQRKILVSELISELDQIIYEIVPALKNFSDNPILLVEENHGISKDGYLFNRNDNRPTEFKATSYYGFLETIRKSGVDVVTTRDLNQSLYWMIAMHGYLSKEHFSKHRKYHSPKEIAIGMLTAVPGIGEVRASKALSHSSIRAMTGMKKVQGLTDKMNERLQDVLKWKE